MNGTKKAYLIRFVTPAVLLLSLATPAYAQDALPDTAAGAVDAIAVGLAALSGLLATALVDALKKFTWLEEKDRSAIAGPLANLVAAIMSIVSAFIVGWAAQLAGLLDQSGVWQVVGFSWPFAKLWFEGSEFRRVLGKLLASLLGPRLGKSLL